jgi:hypothetical protein
MASSRDHRTQATRNRRFYSDVVGGRDAQYDEWAITAIFYYALHRVDDYLANLPARIHPDDHKQRRAALRQHCRNALPIWDRLLNASIEARYKCLHFSPDEIDKYERDAVTELPARLR